MRKKTRVKKHIVQPDFEHNNVIVSKFINYIMRDGKKALARKILYDAFKIIEKQEKRNPLEVFDSAVKNVAPTQEVKSKRVGGANYQVPLQVHGNRRNMLAMSWLLQATRSQTGKATSELLAKELIAAANNEGSAIKRKQDIEKMAHANRAFAHFA